MKEIGIDMENQQPKLLSDSMIEYSSKTVNMGCMDKESCPSLFVKDVLIGIFLILKRNQLMMYEKFVIK